MTAFILSISFYIQLFMYTILIPYRRCLAPSVTKCPLQPSTLTHFCEFRVCWGHWSVIVIERTAQQLMDGPLWSSVCLAVTSRTPLAGTLAPPTGSNQIFMEFPGTSSNNERSERSAGFSGGDRFLWMRRRGQGWGWRWGSLRFALNSQIKFPSCLCSSD